jgi:hypothetical protein
MSIDHNRIKVADLEKGEANQILITNVDGELAFSDMDNPVLSGNFVHRTGEVDETIDGHKLFTESLKVKSGENAVELSPEAWIRLSKLDGSMAVKLKIDDVTNGGIELQAPDESGTIALTSDLDNYLPLTGGTLSGDLSINTKLNNGLLNVSSGNYSHAEGRETQANENYSHSEGFKSIANGQSSHSEGYMTIANGNHSHTEGRQTVTTPWNGSTGGNYANAQGYLSTAGAIYSHAEGYNSITGATADASHAEGRDTKVNAKYAHVEGYLSIANAQYSHAEGKNTQTIGVNSHAEGENTITNNQSSHTEGYGSITNSNYSHAEGKNTQTNGTASHSEGEATNAFGQGSHAEGKATKATGQYSHAEGQSTESVGNYSSAEGLSTVANGIYSKAIGNSTIANGSGQFVFGKYNTINTESLAIIGNGLSDLLRSNLAEFNPESIVFYKNVNIGTAADNGVDKLQVNGSVIATTFKGSLTGNAATVTNGVYTNIDNTYTGINNYSNNVFFNNDVILNSGAIVFNDLSFGDYAFIIATDTYLNLIGSNGRTSISTSSYYGNTILTNNSGKTATISYSSLNNNRTYTIPDASGTLALTSDLTVKANINSPALTGVPTAPTASVGTNTTQVATTAFVQELKKIIVRKIASAITLADSDNATVILLTASCTVTLPNGLMSGFNCSFATQSGATLTYSLGGSVVLINNSGTTMLPLSSHTLVNTGTTNEYLTVGL